MNKFILLLLITFSVLAVENKVPLSEAERYIAAGSEGVQGLYECKDKPSEPCLDFSACTHWETCEIAEVAGQKLLKDNPAKLTAFKARQAAQRQLFEANIQAQKAIDCGNSVKRLILIRNAQKNLTKAEVKQIHKTYSDIDDYLSGGSLNTAKDEILAAKADGRMVTEEDKLIYAAQIDGCKQ